MTRPGRNGANAPDYLRRLPRINPATRKTIRTRWKNEVAALHGVDQGVGAILTALRQVRELDNTYLFFVSDNGIFHGQHRVSYGKYMPHEPSTRQPLVISGPRVEPGNRKYLASTPDLTKTILDLTGVRPGRKLDGISLRPELFDKGRGQARAVSIEGFTIRGGRGPEIERSSAEDPNAARRLAFSGFLSGRWKYVRYAYGEEELYDLKRDPLERRNLAGESRMRERLRWARRAESYLADCQGRRCRPPADLRGLKIAKPVVSPERRELLDALFWAPNRNPGI